MSDLEDLDHEPEDLNIEEELSPSAKRPASAPEESSGSPGAASKSALLKVAAVLVLVVGGGAYFMTLQHSSSKMAQVPRSQHPAKPGTPAPQNSLQANVNIPAWGVVTPSAVPAPPSQAAAPAANSKPHDLLPPAIPAIGQGNGTPASAAPQIVNELPPPASQLSSAGSASPSSPAASIPGMPPPAATPSAPSPPSGALSPQFPAAFTAGENGLKPVSPSGQPVTPPPGIKSGNSMPSVLVPSVDKADLDKAGAGKPAANNAPGATNTGNSFPAANEAELNKEAPAPSAGATATSAAQARIEELQKKIDDLEKIISQLQQAAVEKEDTAGKSAEESAEEKEPAAAPAKRHHVRVASHRKSRPHTQHVAGGKWVLRAAKPGVAWVAKKGSDDLHMVETGDSLTGIGKITSITQDSYGAWVVRGTKGRISQ